MAVISSGSTDIGKKRSTNQDAFLIKPEFNFFLVADGMGGHQGGDIASQMCVTQMSDYFNSLNQNDLPHHSQMEATLRSFIQKTNQDIYRFAEENSHLKGMGTTLCALEVIVDSEHSEMNLLISNIGDSRCYLINSGELYQLTKDHSLVQEKLSHGIYNRDQAQKDPQKNILTRSLGFEEFIEPDFYHYKGHKGDLYLLCSDGLHGRVADEDILFLSSKTLAPIKEFVSSKDSSKSADLLIQNQLNDLVDKLIFEANKNGGNDNITVIAIYLN